MQNTILPDVGPKAVLKSGWFDAVCRIRSFDLLRESKLHHFLPRSGLMLDLGSGFGHISEAILKDAPGRQCVMIDPASSLAPKVRQRLGLRARFFITADGASLPFRDGTFTAAWASFVLHHTSFNKQGDILSEAARVVQPQGFFVLLEDTPQTPREEANTLRADRRLNFEPAGSPHYYRRVEQWRTELERHGFAIREEVAFRGVFPQVTLRPIRHTAFVCQR
jgi:ubiquinone/menaquinone biosynthesis C-methylase UbiE